MRHYGKFSASLAALFGGLLQVVWAPVALGQGGQPAAVIEEVVVTAQRRAESLQEVPISITVIGNQQIERSGMRGARDFVQRSANVTFTESDQQGTKNGTSPFAASVT